MKFFRRKGLNISPPAQGWSLTAPKPKARTNTTMKQALTAALDKKFNERKQQWDAEDAELRLVMGAANGASPRNLALRPASELAGITARFGWFTTSITWIRARAAGSIFLMIAVPPVSPLISVTLKPASAARAAHHVLRDLAGP